MVYNKLHIWPKKWGNKFGQFNSDSTRSFSFGRDLLRVTTQEKNPVATSSRLRSKFST
jgi:hypothetical protein